MVARYDETLTRYRQTNERPEALQAPARKVRNEMNQTYDDRKEAQVQSEQPVSEKSRIARARTRMADDRARRGLAHGSEAELDAELDHEFGSRDFIAIPRSVIEKLSALELKAYAFMLSQAKPYRDKARIKDPETGKHIAEIILEPDEVFISRKQLGKLVNPTSKVPSQVGVRLIERLEALGFVESNPSVERAATGFARGKLFLPLAWLHLIGRPGQPDRREAIEATETAGGALHTTGEKLLYPSLVTEHREGGALVLPGGALHTADSAECQNIFCQSVVTRQDGIPENGGCVALIKNVPFLRNGINGDRGTGKEPTGTAHEVMRDAELNGLPGMKREKAWRVPSEARMNEYSRLRKREQDSVIALLCYAEDDEWKAAVNEARLSHTSSPSAAVGL